MKKALFLTTALCGLTVLTMPVTAQADIKVTTTTTYTYDFPDSKPKVSSKDSVQLNCPINIIGGGGEGGVGSRTVDVNVMGTDGYVGRATVTVDDAGLITSSTLADTTKAYDPNLGWAPQSQQSGGGIGGGIADAIGGFFSGIADAISGVFSGGGDGGGGGKVLCTYFYLKGLLPQEIFDADNAYAAANVSDNVRNGYHAWAIPLVKKLQTGHHPHLEKFLYFWVKSWAYEMAYVMGVTEKSNFVGRMMRLIGEPVCALIGQRVKAQNYQALWV